MTLMQSIQDLDLVRADLLATASRGQRLRARLLPASLRRAAREGDLLRPSKDTSSGVRA